jgi:MFS family permease
MHRLSPQIPANACPACRVPTSVRRAAKAWHDAPAVNEPPGPISPARRFGGITLAPGYQPRHAVSYLYAAFITIGLFAFVSYMQPYLLTVNLELPAHLQGRTLSALNFANELLALCLVAPFGALADKIGRRSVYAFGFLWLGAGFILYPMARSVPQLTGCALFFSVGVAAIGTMLGTVLADTPGEESRGRLVGLTGFFQGLGAAALVLVLGRLPKHLADSGMDALTAGRITLWLAAALCVLSAALVFAGLKRGTPSVRAPAMPLKRILADGASAARSNPRIWFAYLLQFGSFGDRVVLGTFLTLRLQQAWLERDYNMADAAARARLPFVAAMVAGLITALVVGWLLDRVDRLRIGVGAMALAAVAYLLCGFVADPTQDALLVSVAVLLGAGQIAGIIAGQTLLGQEAPRDVRGAVFGLAGICASAGILFTNAFGGWLYDSISKGGPFFLLAGVNFAIFLFGVRLTRKNN